MFARFKTKRKTQGPGSLSPTTTSRVYPSAKRCDRFKQLSRCEKNNCEWNSQNKCVKRKKSTKQQPQRGECDPYKNPITSPLHPTRCNIYLYPYRCTSKNGCKWNRKSCECEEIQKQRIRKQQIQKGEEQRRRAEQRIRSQKREEQQKRKQQSQQREKYQKRKEQRKREEQRRLKQQSQKREQQRKREKSRTLKQLSQQGKRKQLSQQRKRKQQRQKRVNLQRIRSQVIQQRERNLSEQRKVKLCKLTPIQPDTDLKKMIVKPTYKDALFIYNDNEDDYLKHSCEKGKRYAKIRPYRCAYSKPLNLERPRATGIPTGVKRDIMKGRFRNRAYNIKYQRDEANIDKAIDEVSKLLENERYYSEVFFSADKNGKLGTKIFHVDPITKNYITNKLRSAVNSSHCKSRS